MNSIDIAERLEAAFPEAVIEIVEFAGQVSIITKREPIVEIMRSLKDDPCLQFDHLQDLCGVDYKDKKDCRFEVVYQLFSIEKGHSIRIRAEVPEGDASINSVTSIWEGAGWHERECFDMFGIVFKGHKDLRRILMPEDWQGHPLRKDYPLKGQRQPWQGFQEVLDKAEEYRAFETKELTG